MINIEQAGFGTKYVELDEAIARAMTGVDWVEKYYDYGGDDKSWLDIAIDYCLKKGLDADSFDTQEQVEEFLAGVAYKDMVAALGTPADAVKAEEKPGLSDEDYIDPDTILDVAESYSHRGNRRMLNEKVVTVVNDDLDSFDRQDKYDSFVSDTETLDTVERTADDWFNDYTENGGDCTYDEILSTLEAAYGFRGSLADYTYEEAVDAVDSPYCGGSGTQSYEDIDAVDATGDEYEAEDPDGEKYEFGRIDHAAEIDDEIDESCDRKKKLDEVSLGDGIHEGSGKWNYEDDSVKIDIYSNRCEGDDEDDIYLSEAEVFVEYKDPNYDFTTQREKFYDLAYNALNPDDAMDDSYFDGKRTVGKFDFFFKLDDDCEAIVAELAPIAQKVFIGDGISESCGGKKKGKKKGKKFVPFWLKKKKLDEATVPGTFSTGSWDYSNDRVEIHVECYATDIDEDDSEAEWPYEAEVLVEFSDPEVDPTAYMGSDFYAEACAEIEPADSMDDSYTDGEKTIGKYDFFFEDAPDVDEIVKTLAGIAYSKFNPSMKDFDMYDEDEDIDESCHGKKKKKLDETTGFDMAFDDTDYYTEDGECETCVICGKECCGDEGEYNEDGDFVCADCAENSLERPMEEIDPMDIYFRAGRANNIRDMRTFVKSDDYED